MLGVKSRAMLGLHTPSSVTEQWGQAGGTQTEHAFGPRLKGGTHPALQMGN